jgi:hypothetical protein
VSLTIEQVSVDDLEPHPNNPRRGDVNVIAESLTANGQFRPLVISSDNIVLAGNHTLQAAQSLGWGQIDVVRLEVDGDSEEATKVMLADNRSSDLGTYDDGDLVAVLTELDDLLGTGYVADDLDDLKHLTELRDITADTDDAQHSGQGLEADGVTPHKGLSPLAEDYANKAVRSVILAYGLEEFDEITKLMSVARKDLDSESNSDVVLTILRGQYGDS